MTVDSTRASPSMVCCSDRGEIWADEAKWVEAAVPEAMPCTFFVTAESDAVVVVVTLISVEGRFTENSAEVDDGGSRGDGTVASVFVLPMDWSLEGEKASRMGITRDDAKVPGDDWSGGLTGGRTRVGTTGATPPILDVGVVGWMYDELRAETGLTGDVGSFGSISDLEFADASSGPGGTT